MKKHISFYYGYKSDYRTRISMIRDTGFDGVMVLYCFTENFYQECDAILAAGLSIDSLHLPFRGIVNKLWLSDRQSLIFTKKMLEGIDYAASMGIGKVTMHTSATKLPPPKNPAAVTRVKELCDYAAEKGVAICLENLRRKDYFLFITDHISHPNCKICFDSGHMQAFWSGGLQSFSSQVDLSSIVCCHLHDNNGFFDSHLCPYEGAIDWTAVCGILRQTSLDGLTAEVFANKKTVHTTAEREYLKKAYYALVSIEKELHYDEY